MGSEPEAETFFGRYGLADVSRFSDPGQALYAAFGLARGSLGQVLGPVEFVRGAGALMRGATVGRPVGDPRQMPGAFVIYRSVVLRSFVHRRSSDRPDYVALAAGT